MGQIFNIYCDESCHLENDHQQVMVLGAVWCPLSRAREISVRIRRIKMDHGLKAEFEIKWSKVSPAKLGFYSELVRYFFQEPDLHFRALIIPDKSKLRHEIFEQSHDDWYYKMYFNMLKVLFDPTARYHIYLDIKDTRSAAKVAKMHDALCNNLYDFSREIIQRVQTVRSHEVEPLQLADLFIGAVSYANRSLSTSSAKNTLVDLIREKSGYSLLRTTLFLERKINLFRWTALESNVD